MVSDIGSQDGHYAYGCVCFCMVAHLRHGKLQAVYTGLGTELDVRFVVGHYDGRVGVELRIIRSHLMNVYNC